SIHLVVIVRRDRERRVPDETILHVGGRCPARAEWIDLDVLSLAAALVEPNDDAAAAARARRRRPHNVRVDGIGRRPATLAPLDAVPLAARDLVSRAAV